MQSQQEWWRGGVIYQVYPRSFFDSNQDGIGDLAGITQKMDYIASLHVDAIWLSPFFTSPMKDFGYDIANYRDVDPIFGTLDDFDQLLKTAHSHGLKVIIDQVMSHTSDQHPWFKESRRSIDNPKTDWYVWADPKPDGSPPNNWLSIFGGSAWAWDSRRRQYYLHNFLASQPDLNFHNPQVVEQVLADAEFWLKRGVDGFRLDTANFYFHDAKLTDNPANPRIQSAGIGVRPDNPYAYQQHIYDKSRPENIEFLKKLRALLNRYPNTTTVGEIGCDHSLKTMAAYTSGNDKLHMAYSFDLLTEQYSAAFIRHTVESLETEITDGWPCWSIGNHDVTRVLSRWSKQQDEASQAKLYLALLMSLRGSICLYQGEELGLTEAELSFEDLQDPYGINFWPEFKGRDGCRTPMPWQQDQINAGFSQVKPWLPVPAEHYIKSVDGQINDPDSLLSIYRSLLAWRKQQPALVTGTIQFLPSPQDTLFFTRENEHQQLMVAFNLSRQEQEITIDSANYNLLDVPYISGSMDNNKIHLPPYQACFLERNTANNHGEI
ncbi:alpha glucosidase [Endozoicomonas sp. SM1973]|uniref:Alpha glucosidase n=1 Tax=Spartinivicinus marinus TaxID=2994442 RepID=A0A853IF52_9GAMM|nr:alpha-glucosidase [Spartinivicinus marinus]MCX4028390.1 alpha glucosidase [Spartinivicinus marinus]NYZ68611.1 alpha glucosidase [Spartinivicinus marinus]